MQARLREGLRYILSLPIEFGIIGAACALSGAGEIGGVVLLAMLAIAGALAGARIFFMEAVSVPSSPYSYAGVPLLVLALISAVFAAGGTLVKLFGANFEFGTLALFLCFAIFIALGSYARPISLIAFLYAFESVALVRALYETSSLIAYHASGELPVLLMFMLIVCMVLAVLFALLSKDMRSRSWHGTVAAICCASAVMILYSYHAGPLLIVAPPLDSDSILASRNFASLRATLIGSGGGSFQDSWNTYRSYELNTTPFWKTPPSSAYDTVFELAITNGLLGLAAFLLVPAGLTYLLYRERTRTVLWNDPSFVVPFIVALCCFLIACIAPIDQSIFLLFGFSVGACVRWLDTPASYEVRLTKEQRHGVGAALVVAACAGLVVSGLQYKALRADTSGLAQVQSDPVAASTQLRNAADTWPAPGYMKDAAQGIMGVAVQDARTQVASNYINAPALLALVDEAEAFSDRSVGPLGDPASADLWIARASIYLSAASLSVPGAIDQAQHSLAQAQALAPTRVDVYYDEAVLALFNNDTGLARAYLDKALILKPDYQGAQDLLATLGS